MMGYRGLLTCSCISPISLRWFENCIYHFCLIVSQSFQLDYTLTVQDTLTVVIRDVG